MGKSCCRLPGQLVPVLLLANLCMSPVYPSVEVIPLVENGPVENRINLVFLSEGYRTEDLDAFRALAEHLSSYLFEIEPFFEYRNAFNCYAVPVASNQSGSDHPSIGVLKDTYFNSSFDSWGLERGLTVPPNDRDPDPENGFGKAQTLLQSVFPDYDVIIFVVNDPDFGGWGDFRGVVISAHDQAGEFFVHELGHTLGGLGDEYSAPFPLDPYPVVEEPNTTRETRLNLLKWRAWIAPETPIPTPDSLQFDEKVGLFEGARYHELGWFRPKRNCKMRSLYQPFCEVCREALVLAFYGLVQPIDQLRPAERHFDVFANSILRFEVNTIPWIRHGMHYGWSLDGVPLSEWSGPKMEVTTPELGNGTHRVELTVSDPTQFVREDQDKILEQWTHWTVDVSGLNTSDGRRLFFPRILRAPEFFTGVALTNASPEPLSVQLTDYDARGNPSSDPGMTLALEPGRQIAKLAEELVGGSGHDADTWIIADMGNSGIGGLYLTGDGVKELDGAGPQLLPSRILSFPGVSHLNGVPVSAELLIGNPTRQMIDLRIRYWSEGEVKNEEFLSVQSHGFVRKEVAEQATSNAYHEITVERGIGAVAWQVLRSEPHRTSVILSALTNPIRNGYSAQFAAQEGVILTRIDLINPSDQPDQVSLEIFRDDGTPALDPKEIVIGARSVVAVDSTQLFGPASSEKISGSLVVNSEEGNLLASVIFADAGNGLKFAAGLPLQAETLRSAFFCQLAENSRIFTGIALFNPAATEAEVHLKVLSPTGEAAGQQTLLLPPRGRASRLISEWIPAARGMSAGYIRVDADHPFVVQQLFGDTRLQYLAAVPATGLAH